MAATIIGLSAIELEIHVLSGDTMVVPLTWKDSSDVVIPLSGYTARMHLRTTPGEVTTELELTHASGITLADTEPNIIMTITDAQTTTLAVGAYFFDLELTSGTGVVSTKAFGKIIIEQDVTR